MLAIGANDLTSELGAPGDYAHPALRDAIVTAAAACERHGKLLMLGGTADPALYRRSGRLPAALDRERQRAALPSRRARTSWRR